MTAWEWLTAVLIVFNAVMSVVNMWRLRRTMLLERLLGLIVVKAFTLRQQPIWQAWAETMGDIRVEVSSRKKGLD